MQLVRVNSLPKEAVKDGEPVRLNQGTAQDYRYGDDLYEYVTRKNGEVRVFKVVQD